MRKLILMSGIVPNGKPPLDVQLGARLRMAALWTAMMFVFAYVDLFSLYRADVIAGLAQNRIAIFDVSQGFLLITTAYVIVPSLMIYLVMVIPPRLNRWLNPVLAALYAITIAGSAVGETWAYYVFGSVVEIILLVLLAYTAWTAPVSD